MFTLQQFLEILLEARKEVNDKSKTVPMFSKFWCGYIDSAMASFMVPKAENMRKAQTAQPVKNPKKTPILARKPWFIWINLMEADKTNKATFKPTNKDKVISKRKFKGIIINPRFPVM